MRKPVILVVFLAILAAVVLAAWGLRHTPPPAPKPAISGTVTYGADFCTDDRLAAVRFARGTNVNGVPRATVRLREGCFAGPYILPDDWISWDVLPTEIQGKREEWWIATRYPTRTIAPRGVDANLSKDGTVGREVYLQGKEGEYVTFIRTDR